jgi:hypothetical protein
MQGKEKCRMIYIYVEVIIYRMIYTTRIYNRLSFSVVCVQKNGSVLIVQFQSRIIEIISSTYTKNLLSIKIINGCERIINRCYE